MSNFIELSVITLLTAAGLGWYVWRKVKAYRALYREARAHFKPGAR